LSATIPISDARMSDIYDFVSQRIRTVDLPAGTTGFQSRNPARKRWLLDMGRRKISFLLFAALGKQLFSDQHASGLYSSIGNVERNRSSFSRWVSIIFLTRSGYPSISFWMDLNLENLRHSELIAAKFSAKARYSSSVPQSENRWEIVLDSFPSRSQQTVTVQRGD